MWVPKFGLNSKIGCPQHYTDHHLSNHHSFSYGETTEEKVHSTVSQSGPHVAEVRIRASMELTWIISNWRFRQCYAFTISQLIFIVIILFMCSTSPHIDSYPLTAAYKPQWIGSTLVQIMACRLYGAKLLSKLMLGYLSIPSKHDRNGPEMAQCIFTI